MKRHNILGIMAGLTVSALISTSTLAQDQVSFVIAASIAGSPSDIAADEIIAELSERTDGRIQGRKVAGDALGGERELTEAIQLNSIDMALISDMGMDSVVGELGFAWFPYMFTTYAEADEFYIDGWIGEEIDKVLLESGIVPVAEIENGFRVLSNAERSIQSLGDLEGLKIRVPEIPELLRFYELAGALSVAIGGTEVLPALQQGTIDGVDNSVMNLQLMGVIEPQAYLTRTNHSYSAGHIVAGTRLWGALSEEDKSLITEVADAAGERQIERSRALEEELYASIEERGWIEIEEVSPELDAGLREVALQVWEEFGDRYDPEVMERIRADYY